MYAVSRDSFSSFLCLTYDARLACWASPRNLTWWMYRGVFDLGPVTLIHDLRGLRYVRRRFVPVSVGRDDDLLDKHP